MLRGCGVLSGERLAPPTVMKKKEKTCEAEFDKSGDDEAAAKVEKHLLPMGAAPPKYYQITIKVLFRKTTRSSIKILSKYNDGLAGS